MFIRHILKSVFSVIASFLFAGCTLGYKNDGKEVTWHSWNEGWGHTSFKVDADPKTFKALRGSYGRDSEHVFFMGGIMEGADPKTFKVLKDAYAHDNIHAYHRGGVLKGADGKSFQSLGEQYARDKSRVYLDGEEIKSADPETFEVHTHYLTEDRKDFYWLGKALNVQDKSTFTVLGDKDYSGTHWAKDRYNGYFMEDGSVIRGIDYASFHPVAEEVHLYSGCYAADKTNVYYMDKVVKGADPVSFKEIDYRIGQDINGVYQEDRITQVKDYSLLKKIVRDGHMFTDNQYIYDFDFNILPDADLATFRHICNRWYRDKSHIWWNNQPLPDVVDINTFRPVWKTSVRNGRESVEEDSDYGCDKNHVYYHDSIIEGADPLSFWLVNLNDRNGWIAYDFKKIYAGKETPAFRQYFKERYDCDFQ